MISRRATVSSDPQTLINDDINPSSPADITRSVTFGRTEGGGVYLNASISPEGHQEIAIMAPRTAFGELAVASDVPGIQRSHFQYGFNTRLDRRVLTGSATFDKGAGVEKTLMIASTGTTPGSVAIGGSARREVYFAGNGKKIEFTARFTTPTAGTEQWLAIGDERDGLGIGCNGTSVGLRHWYFGQFEIRQLEITTASSAVENATVTLNGVAKVIALVNASANKNITANAIASADYSTTGGGWDAFSYTNGASVYVVFVSRVASPLAGAYTLSSGTAAGTFTRTTAGAAPTVEWIPQSTWSYDKLDGSSTPANPDATNPSGFDLDPTDLGVYKLSIQYLGNGDLLFFVENPANGQFSITHLIARAGEFAQTSFGNMALPITLYASNGATSTNIKVATASYYAANEGERVLSGVSVPVRNFRTSVGASEVAILSIHNPLVWGDEPNTIPLIVTNFDLTNTGGTGLAAWRFVRNSVRGTGATAISSFVKATDSPMLSDVTYAGAVTGGSDVAYAYQAPGQGTQRTFDFVNTDAGRIYPGETWTVCVATTTGAGITCGATLNVRPDN